MCIPGAERKIGTPQERQSKGLTKLTRLAARITERVQMFRKLSTLILSAFNIYGDNKHLILVYNIVKYSWEACDSQLS